MEIIRKTHNEAEEKMKKGADTLTRELSSIRIGKATTSLLDGIKVDYYGTLTPLSQVASISILDPKLIVVQPWEKKMIPEITKTIQRSDLGLNPLTDANVIRLPIPPLTEERRKDLVKLVKKLAEEGKVVVRNIRRDANESLKKAEKDRLISEDDSRKAVERMQELTDKYIKAIDALVEKKEKEMMEI